MSSPGCDIRCKRWPISDLACRSSAITLTSGSKMKSMTVTRSTVGIAGIILVAAVGMTWSLARGKHSEVESLRAQIATCNDRASAKIAESARDTNAALAEKKREIILVQKLKTENEQLRRASEKKEQELASAEPGQSGGGAVRPRPEARPRQEAAAPPVQTIELSPGEQRDMIPGVLNVMVETVDSASAQVWYGGHLRHLKVGESAAIDYLGRSCVLGLTEIKGGGDTQKGSFSFLVMEPQR